MYEQILYDVEDPVATITLNRPKQLNAWTDQMAAEVKHAVAAAENDAKVVAIVLTGAGRGFCSGADMRVLQGISQGGRPQPAPEQLRADPGDPEMGGFRGAFTYLLSVRKPIIAAINGPCAGMAVPIALSCDLRFASEEASFLTAFSRRGLIAEWGASWILTRLVGPSRALDLLLSSRKLGAAEAERMGLVNRVLPPERLLPEAREYAEELARNCSPTSMAVMKRQVYEHLTGPLDHAEKEAFEGMLASFQRPDFKEGVQAFLEKRPPKFERI